MSELHWYKVSRGNWTMHFQAKSADAAKREMCHVADVSPSDAWCGLSICHAHKMTVAEVAEFLK